MSTAIHCIGCQRQLESEWRVCPYCGRTSVAIAQVQANAETKIASANPYADLGTEESMVSAQQEGRDDLTRIGLGLIVCGVLGFIGCVVVLFSDRNLWQTFGSSKSAQTVILLVGGIVVAMVITGTSIFVIRGKGDAMQRGAIGLLGGLLSGLMIFAFAALWVLAVIIYLIEDCLRGCR